MRHRDHTADQRTKLSEPVRASALLGAGKSDRMCLSTTNHPSNLQMRPTVGAQGTLKTLWCAETQLEAAAETDQTAAIFPYLLT